MRCGLLTAGCSCRYLMPVMFPDSAELVEALVSSIQHSNLVAGDESAIQVYSMNMIWTLTAVVSIQCAWRSYRERKRAAAGLLQRMLDRRAGMFLKQWLHWRMFDKRIALFKVSRARPDRRASAASNSRARPPPVRLLDKSDERQSRSPPAGDA